MNLSIHHPDFHNLSTCQLDFMLKFSTSGSHFLVLSLSIVFSPHTQSGHVTLQLKTLEYVYCHLDKVQVTISVDSGPAYFSRLFSTSHLYLFMHPYPVEPSAVPWICHTLLPPWSDTFPLQLIFHLVNSYVSLCFI